MTEKDMDEPRTNLRSSGRVPWIVAAAAAALAGAYGAYRLFHRGDEGAAQAAGSAPSPAPAEAAATPPPETDQPVDAAGARTLLESVAKDPLVRSWLAEADPIRRAVVIVANLAENASPRRQLEAFAPSGGFSVAERGQRYVISPASFARYDAFAAAVESVDAQALATAYRRLHGVLEGAARALGYPAGALDHLAARALRRIEAAPLADEEVPVEHQGDVWVFADPKLERLGEVDKHLLRMGRRNEARVQAKAREIREALHIPAQVASGGR